MARMFVSWLGAGVVVLGAALSPWALAAEKVNTNRSTESRTPVEIKPTAPVARNGFLSWFSAALRMEQSRRGIAGSAATHQATATLGIRGLGEDGGTGAQFKSDELQQLRLYSLSRSDADDFAQSAGLAQSAQIALAGMAGAGPALSPEISEAREIEMGDELAISMLAGGKLLNHDAAQAYVNQVGRWLAEGTDRADLPWQFGIMDRPELGAYALPGGKVLITVGMLRKLRDESELAAVLAHEMAHVVRRHQLPTLVAGQGAESLGAVTGALAPALEFDADRLAAAMVARGGYDAAALPSVLRALQSERAKDQGLALLESIHPAFKDRIEAVQPEIARVSALVRPVNLDKGKARFATLLVSLRGAGRK